MGMTLLFALLLAVLIGFFALRIWAHTAPQPELGAEHGKLAPCPESPNCVSSEASDEEHAIAPLELPVGSLLAFLGGPTLLYLLWKHLA